MENKPSDSSQPNGLPKKVYETAFELAAIGMALVAPDGRWIRVNRQLCDIVGYTESELLALTFQDITHPDDLDIDLRQVKQMLDREIESYSLEKRYRRKDGSIIWAQLTVALVWNADQSPSHFISCVQNIAARKKAEDALRTHRWQLKLLLDYAPVSIALFDRSMRYIECSARWLSDYGLQGQTLKGRSHYEIFPEIPDHWKRIHQRALNGESIREDEDTFMRKDGSVNYLRWEIIPWYESIDEVGGIVIFTEDITHRISSVKQLRLGSWVFQNSAQGILVTDENAVILSVNQAFIDITGFNSEDAIGQSARILKSGRQDATFYSEMWKAIIATGQWHGEIWNRRKNGELYPEHLYISTVFDDQGKVQCRIGMFTDISDQKAAEEAIAFQANYDQLTHLPNRRLFSDRLEQALKRAHREGCLCALLFIDLDHFKDINDSQGHDIGDQVLSEAARRINQCVRDYDTVCRFGGDEFTVILSDVTDVAAAGRVGSEIVTRLSTPFTVEDQDFYISASVGIALYPDDADNAVDLIKCADQAMYKAKSEGRRRITFFTRGMQEATELRSRLSNELRNALVGTQFALHYQPIIELASGEIYKAEALIRWFHPKHGLVSPAAFIPIAEDTGLIHEIGDWAFSEVLAMIRCWQSRRDHPVQIALNMSPVQFRHALGHGHWLKALQDHDIPGNQLVLEITEGLLMANDQQIQERLLAFRDAGIQIAIDDFGTGYSALSYLKRFNIDFLKIDRSFVMNLSEESTDLALCEAMVVMAHKLGLKVVAEGVETEQQRDLLKRISCDYAQGYLFSRPIPADEFKSKFS